MLFFGVFFFKQKTAYEMLRSLVGSEMCIRDRNRAILDQGWGVLVTRLEQKAPGRVEQVNAAHTSQRCHACLLYTSDAADEEDSVDLGGRRIIKKKKKKKR